MAGLVAASPLSALGKLNREWLHVFVTGPGEGEGIAIALPERGWVLVDGCRATHGLPLKEVLRTWRAADEPLFAYVLTHCHDDHVKGLVEILEETPPAHVAITGGLTRRPEDRNVPSRLLVARTVNAALQAIERWSDLHPGQLIDLVDGGVVPVPGPAKVAFRAPDAALARAHVKAAQETGLDANILSGVLEVEYGATRILLGGDLPRFHPGGRRVVPTGWDLVMNRHPHLGQHSALKLPHHGSAEAFHPSLMVPGTNRLWLATPYNRSDLPNVIDMDGLPQLLACQDPIMLTAIPVSKTLQSQVAHPARVTLAQLAKRVQSKSTGVPFLDAGAVEVTPRVATAPLDAVWAFACDNQGNVVGRWRGPVAFELTQ
jgi:hypothetical protein